MKLKRLWPRFLRHPKELVMGDPVLTEMVAMNVGLVGHIDKMTTKRFKIFQKIAQAQTPAPASTTTSTAPSTVPGSPATVTTDLFPNFENAWGANYKEPTNELLNILNWAIFVLTVGQHDFFKMRMNDFQSDATKYDAFTGSVISLSRSVYHKLLNGGKPFTTQIGDKKTPIAQLYAEVNGNSRIPDTLTNVFPQSFLQTKVGNFKSQVISILSKLNALAG